MRAPASLLLTCLVVACGNSSSSTSSSAQGGIGTGGLAASPAVGGYFEGGSGADTGGAGDVPGAGDSAAGATGGRTGGTGSATAGGAFGGVPPTGGASQGGTTAGGAGTEDGGATSPGGTSSGGSPPDPCTSRTLAGEANAAEPGVLASCDALWWAGYESLEWTDAWGLAWGPSPASNHALTTDHRLHGEQSARVTYHAPGSGPEDANGYGPDDGVQYLMRFANLTPAVSALDEAYLRYYVRFDPGFDFVLGGKLPGLVGGEANTGGDVPNGTDGWSARMMWRAGGKVVQYVYHPEIAEYGEDMDWSQGGQRYFAPGKWHCVETQILMNSVIDGAGQHDGVVRSWFDGDLALERTNVRFRDVDTLKIDGLYFSTFFGGSDATWAPAENQGAQFDNFVVSRAPIGCCAECDLGDYVPVDPQPAITITSSELIFDGEQAAWTPGSWNNGGTYDFTHADQNHTNGGSACAAVELAPGVWDATYFDKGSDADLSERTHLVFWAMASSAEVEFRVQFRGGANSADVVVNGSPSWFAEGWQVGEWQRVVIPLEDFDLTSTVDSVYFRSNSDASPATPRFYLDDVALVTATTG